MPHPPARPGGFAFIGIDMAPGGTFHIVHTPHYDRNDAILTLDSACWISLVRQELGAG